MRHILTSVFLVVLLFPALAVGEEVTMDDLVEREELDYSFTRPLVVQSKIRNDVRFDIISPQEFYLKNGSESSWYNDTILIVRSLANGNVMHAELQLGYGKFEFLEDIQVERLSKDYFVVKESTGGASCCIIYHVFEIEPNFKKLFEHNNDFFDNTEVVVGSHQLEFHMSDWIEELGNRAHVDLQYNPGIYDLKTNCWNDANSSSFLDRIMMFFDIGGLCGE